ncbi:hypothetical protein L3X38_030503 [Prunus dulcis]|uniref:Uncharacterized protein n=1 Tax=Prunus dulcis TaxID=3755 RepID=A0AAD4VBW6_PRUDU|nr:hypothetical protein L3X38_030503 [Prunus dulcis]
MLPLMAAATFVPGPEKIPPHLKTHFIELKGAQVKIVSFLTYLLKSFGSCLGVWTRLVRIGLGVLDCFGLDWVRL